MAWNPQVYNQFQDVRNAPFYDLIANLTEEGLYRGIDLGCGTGVQTALLAGRLPDCAMTGIDSSAEMLADVHAFSQPNLTFKLQSIEDFVSSGETVDLLFSNAALQWVEGHEELFPQLIERINPRGQMAIQMPCQSENVLNQLLSGIIKEMPFKGWLEGYERHSPVLTIDEYARLLYENGLEQLNLQIKVYPLIATDAQVLYQFSAGTTLIPYFERLNAEQQHELTKTILTRIDHYFTKYPAIYAFKRLLLYGVKRS